MNTTTTRRIRTAVVIAVASAAVTLTAPGAVAIPRGDGAEPGPTQRVGRPDPAPPYLVPALDVATGERPCFIWHATWNTAEGPEPTCAVPPATARVEPVPEIGEPTCRGVVEARYAPTSGTDPGPSVCAPPDHWWDFIPV